MRNVFTDTGQSTLAGKRTYLITCGILLSAIGGYLIGEMSLAEAINVALTGLGLTTLRLALPPTRGIR